MSRGHFKQKKKNGFYVIKIQEETYNDLMKEIKKQEKQSPYLKRVLSFDIIIKMLLYKRRIKLSKYKYIKRELKRGFK